MATVYNVLDTRDKQELTEKIDADKNELSKTIQNTKTELQSNIDALESQHDEDKIELQTQINNLGSTKADKTEITAHNTSNTAHNDIRLLIQNLTTKLNTIADSDDSTLDQMSEIVEYIKNNKELIDAITTTKVSVSDIINNLVTNVANKPLSAAMGVELKALIDAIPDTTLATVNEKILEHNVSADAHEDIRNDIVSLQSDVVTAQAAAETAQTSADNAQDDADEALQRLNSLEVGSGKIDRIVEGGGIITCEDPLIGAPLIETVVRGRTVKNLWPVINVSDGAVTTDETGLITVDVTPESTLYASAKAQGIAVNKSYTLKVSNTSNSSTSTWIIYVEERDADGTYIASSVTVSGRPVVTFTTAANCAQLICMIIVYAGYAANFTTRVMLVEGTEAPDCFTPPASIASVEAGKMVVAGKNLLDISAWTKVGKNGQLTVQPDGSWKCDGYPNYGDSGFTSPILPPGSYHVDVSDVTDGAQVGLTCSVAQSGFLLNDVWSKYGCEYVAFNVSNFTFVSSVPFRIGVMINSAKYGEETQPTIYVHNPQLELGSTATVYEPPTVTEVALPEMEPLMFIYDRGDELVIAQDGTVSVERQTFHELFDGSGGYPNPVDADGYQYVALNSTKVKPSGVTIPMAAVVSDRFATGKRAPGNVVVTTGSVSGDGRNYIALLFCFESGTFADSDEARQWFVDNPTNVWFAGMPEIEYLGTIEPPTLPAQTSHVWFSSNIPVNDFSVRYWLPNGELVEELYRTGATEEISDNEIMSIWNGVTGDVIEATNADIEAIFE